MSDPESQETFDDCFQIGSFDAKEIASKIDQTMSALRVPAGDYARSLFMRHGYFNGRADSFVEHEGDWIYCKVVVSCYGLPERLKVKEASR